MMDILPCFLIFSSYPLVRLLIQGLRCRERFNECKASKIAFWNSVIIVFVLVVVNAIDSLVSGAGNAFTFALEGAYDFSLIGVLFYWLNRTFLTKRTEKENSDD